MARTAAAISVISAADGDGTGTGTAPLPEHTEQPSLFESNITNDSTRVVQKCLRVC